ncbi:hypothetical protein [Clavibacter tessellarius]|uniref:hypothetical protein n=1 Tax=Clavibacter tessellarius TaxID=31965 RepID=UPI0032440DCE
MSITRVRDAVVRAWRAATSPGRLILAAKTALAVGIAWAVAPMCRASPTSTPTTRRSARS